MPPDDPDNHGTGSVGHWETTEQKTQCPPMEACRRAVFVLCFDRVE